MWAPGRRRASRFRGRDWFTYRLGGILRAKHNAAYQTQPQPEAGPGNQRLYETRAVQSSVPTGRPGTDLLTNLHFKCRYQRVSASREMTIGLSRPTGRRLGDAKSAVEPSRCWHARAADATAPLHVSVSSGQREGSGRGI